ncbi:MAG TPA: peptidase E [Kofleriaceae bacterium]|nr:peptidase E [Kofleriaceae bacterium]
MSKTIIALGGGGFSMELSPLLDDFILAAAGKPDPRVLLVPTAGGDAADYITRFYRTVGRRARGTHVELFRRIEPDLRAFVLQHDIVYVGGGNTANMLAVWRVHGFDAVLREAYEAGIVCAGISAGAVCWFEGAVTDSLHPELRPLHDGLGLLRGTMVPHYDGDAQRRPTLHRLIADGTFSSAWAADDGAALVFRDGAFVEAVANHASKSGWRIERGADGTALETRVPPRVLT